MTIFILAMACAKEEPPTPLGLCAGPYVGEFTGDQEGEVSAELDEDGLLVVSFDSPEGTVVAAGGVEPDGSLSGSTLGLEVEGQFAFDSCTAEGTWLAEQAERSFQGTWLMEPE